MELITDLAQITAPLNNAVLTIGNFDGVHLGHQALFRQVIEKARDINGTSVVMTFDPHPVRVLNCGKHFRLITLYEQKVELIASTGIDTLICVPFTREFAATPARTFVKDILCDLIGMKGVVVGQDYSFGKKREGNISLLNDMGRTYGFEVIVSGWVEAGPRRISSTEVRNLVKEGQMAEARELLGRHYQVRGTVTRGRDRGGRLLGFPTANLRLTDELCPKGGVYTVTVEVENKTYDGVANIGYSPTFDNGEFSIEAHILDFDQDIYDQPIRVNFIQRLRGEKKFSGPEALATQINKDIAQAREILSRP
ncbi:MAG: bifunctional riboflavin kinase/FAD synthetase [Thermodesulfobacteriota bacterium]|nr:bifunctional riboflavin kinase/FAD synthetase [Thermodesulfobacteriota bacterium]